jgi:spore maturation protein CgeB
MVKAFQEDKNEVIVFEPLSGWSFNNMLRFEGIKSVSHYIEKFPDIDLKFYDQEDLENEPAYKELDNADLVIVHEWNSPKLIKKIGRHRRLKGKYILLFHDTHHRSLSDSKSMSKIDLTEYDGVLAFGEVIREIYVKNKWASAAWTWHEAADVSLFHPIRSTGITKKDLVWIGNWGDEERTAELFEFIINPVRELGLTATFYGVRYPPQAIKALKDANIEYKGWAANYEVPLIFSQHRLTVHVPRRLYSNTLKGIPTIRPFEAMACGIPLISAPWHDSEGLFRTDKDYLLVTNGDEMKKALKEVLSNNQLAVSLSANGMETINSRHTCHHRKEELMNILKEIKHSSIKTALSV